MDLINRGAVTLGTIAVVGNAFWLFDQGPPWSQAVRWFLAGMCSGLLVAGWIRWESRRIRKELERREIARMATEMATAIEADLRSRGIIGEVDIEEIKRDGARLH